MYCKECGNQIADGSKFCASCGKPQSGEVVSNPETSNTDILQLKDEIKKLKQEEFYHRLQDQSKSKWVALLLCIFLGEFGAHRFYVGKTGTGVLMLLFGLPSIILFSVATYISDMAEISGKNLSEGVSTLVTISAILMVIFGIWLLIDLIRIITGSFIDSNDYVISEINPLINSLPKDSSLISKKDASSFGGCLLIVLVIALLIALFVLIHLSMK